MTARRTMIAPALALALLAGCSATDAPERALGAPEPRPTVEQPAPEPTSTPEPLAVDYFLVPHPDDEFQVWAEVEGSSAFKVFVLMTRGEGTGLCANRPDPSTSCAEARISSWLGFFEAMSEYDSTVPGDFAAPSTHSLKDEPAGTTDSTVTVWLDEQGRGALLALNLGDGDLTAEEVEWATRAVMGNAELGIPDSSSERVLGAYANATNPDCYVYPHRDHVAIHQALTTENLSVQTQGYATCASSPGVAFRSQVSDDTLAAAWGERGAFPAHYGWLGGYVVDPHGQGQIFHGAQAFYVRSDR